MSKKDKKAKKQEAEKLKKTHGGSGDPGDFINRAVGSADVGRDPASH